MEVIAIISLEYLEVYAPELRRRGVPTVGFALEIHEG